jgi:hypothetical protein
MKDVDREAPTPRESATWEFQRGVAKGLSQQLQDEEIRLGKVSPSLDTGRANMLRYQRMVVDHYAALFEREVRPGAPGMGARDRSEFSALVRLVQALLEPRA